jgi:hypothetical protein
MKRMYMPKSLFFITLYILLFLFSCKNKLPDSLIESGISKELVELRTTQISNVNYLLYLKIPEEKPYEIKASLVLEFFLADNSEPLILDFHPENSYLLDIYIQGVSLPYTYYNGHIIIEGKEFDPGYQQLEFQFNIPQESLLTGKNVLLIHPNAFLAFPAFYQANLNASFLLNMEIPAKHTAISNAPLLRQSVRGSRKSIAFAKTSIIAVDQFSFISGNLIMLQAKTDTTAITIYYPEQDGIAEKDILSGIKLFVNKESKVQLKKTKTDYVFLNDIPQSDPFQLPGITIITAVDQ